ncbi:MAG: LPS assembly protein LptD [Kangiellaceae bacterium]|nr:LPS assembly protein LptD [Kangiellaceae bacterium]
MSYPTIRTNHLLIRTISSVLSIGICTSIALPIFASTTEQDSDADSEEPVYFKSQFSGAGDTNNNYKILNTCPSRELYNSLAPISQGQTSNYQEVEQNVRLTADSVPQNDERILSLKGNVTMTTSISELKADSLVSDKEKQQLVAEGGVSVETKESLLRADNFKGSQQTRRSKLEQVDFHFFENNANGRAESIETDETNTATLKELTYSTCPTDNESWRFSASELKLDSESGWGEAWGMWLKVKGIPVFYFPYVNFPLGDQRKSGILQPAFSNDDKNGLDILLPVYWNIAPHADATFNFRNIQHRGLQFGSEFRYMTRSSSSELAFEWLGDDRLVNDLIAAEPDLAAGRYGLQEDRWAVSFSNQFNFNQYWSSKIKTSKVSDRDYFTDLGAGAIESYGTNSQTQLISQTDFTYQDDIWLVSFLAEATQSLQGEEPYRIMPSAVASADYYHQESGLHWQFESDLTRFSHNDSSKIEGLRLNLMPSVSFPIRTSYSWLTPKMSYQSSRYQQKNEMEETEETISRNLPVVSVDTGLYFDRSIEWKGSSIIHSLEPRANYAYIPLRNQQDIHNFSSRLPEFSFSQLWQANRFAGVDRVGDTNHLAFALTNRFVDEQTGAQLLAFSFGRKNYFEDRQVVLEASDSIDNSTHSTWLAEVTYQPDPTFEFTGFIEWSDDNRDQNINNGTNLARSQIKFEPKPDHIVNLSHRLRNKDGFSNEELDLSFAWPINEQWRLVGRWYNDLERGRTSETLFGFEYQSCCFAVNLVSRRYLDVRLDAFGNPTAQGAAAALDDEFNSGIELQFVFKGFGSAGNDVSALLTKSIRGYQARD